MLLEHRTAVVYGAGGAIGSAMAEGFAAEGAHCFLVGRTAATLEATAARIQAAGGRAETAVLDVLDAAAVRDHADSIVEKTGALDISVNVVSQQAVFGPLLDLPVADVAAAMTGLITSHLNTTQAAARHMTKQESGVLLFFGGSDHANKTPGMGNVQIGFDTVEALRRQWAADLAPHGIRVLSLLTGGIPETLPDLPEMQGIRRSMIDATLLKRAATRTDVARVAAFAVSDHARAMTSTQINISAGAVGD